MGDARIELHHQSAADGHFRRQVAQDSHQCHGGRDLQITENLSRGREVGGTRESPAEKALNQIDGAGAGLASWEPVWSVV